MFAERHSLFADRQSATERLGNCVFHYSDNPNFRVSNKACDQFDRKNQNKTRYYSQQI
jgi:hypothetical protein